LVLQRHQDTSAANYRGKYNPAAANYRGNESRRQQTAKEMRVGGS